MLLSWRRVDLMTIASLFLVCGSRTTTIALSPLMLTSISAIDLVLKPTLETVKLYFFPVSNVMLKLPSTSATTTFLVSSTKTEAPAIGSFFVLMTFPVILCTCAKTDPDNKMVITSRTDILVCKSFNILVFDEQRNIYSIKRGLALY